MQVWAAINWRGDLNVGNPCENTHPTDEQFKNFFHSDEQISLDHISSDTHVPILDDPITVVEVNEQLKDLKSEKAAGNNDVPPGVLKLLPATWIVCITFLINSLFSNSIYPKSWAIAKLFTIFKKGDKRLQANYRGITIINCLAILYYMVL